jgi:DNA helicase II / ATP-dependent DNA helicase PcrA
MDLSSLNDRQKEAVTAPLGPVLVLAGAGSGKTRALAFRIAYLCGKKLVKPESILALTFTNKAAKEMQDRVKKILHGQPCSIPHMGTFHSVCARLLRQEITRLGYTRGFAIFDSDDQLKVLREIVSDLHLDKRFSPTLFKAYISSAKNALQAPGELSLGLEADMENLVREVYVRYQDFLYKQNALDFDDLLMLIVKVFQNFPAVLKKYQDLFKYILVDEYQDTNHAQYVLLYLLAEHHHNLFVVGDDAQSIYGFRGSSIRNILNFEQDFPESRVIKLEQNYRSTQNILAVAQKVIELNPEQKPKVLWTANDAGQKVIIEELSDERAEAVFVAKKIIALSTGQEEELSYEPEEEQQTQGFSILDHFLKKAKKAGGKHIPAGLSFLPQLPKDHQSLNQYAVLFRTHAQSRVLEEIFIESGIPYQIVGGVKFYERKEIKDLLAYLRLVQNYRDLVSLKRVINEPPRGVGDKSFQHVRDLVMRQSLGEGSDRQALPLPEFAAKLEQLEVGSRALQGITDFFDLLLRFTELPPKENLPSLMRLIAKRAKMEEWLRDGTEMGEARWENVQELLTVAEKFSGKPWAEGLEQFLEEVSLLTEIDELNETTDTVTLMTLHSAKGLEFDTVFLVGLEEGILPHSRSLLNPSELSEEVRLAYVGLTRARKNLFLTYANTRRAFGSLQFNSPSRILRALPKDKIIHHGNSLDLDYDSGRDGEGLDF